jgi:hypothetical protein
MSDIKFFRTARYTLFDHERNKEILVRLKIEPVDEKLGGYKSITTCNKNEKKKNGMPKIMLNCRPNGRRRRGTPLKRLIDERPK